MSWAIITMQMMVILGKQLNIGRFLLENQKNQMAYRHNSVGLCLKFDLKSSFELETHETTEESCAFPLLCCVIQGRGYPPSRDKDVDQWVQYSIWDSVDGFGNRQSWAHRRNSEAVQRDVSSGSCRELGAFVSACKFFFSIRFTKRKILFNRIWSILLTVIFI